MDAAAELPDDLADEAAERLLAAGESDVDAILAALVAAHPQHAVALRRLPQELAAARRLLEGTFPDRTAVPRTIGDHRVVRVLGEGAFGTVYLCEQVRPVVRQVAIKVLRPGVGDAKTLRRFAAEGQVLASLNHPTITHVFDVGTLPDGRPYFVMEYVDGTTLRRYCEQRELPCRARLELFLAICRGVAHAHKRGIVHRDLKPANVLVQDGENGPQPKIIDFGIAKVLATTGGRAILHTDAGRVVGTPGYMSPEQAAGDPAAVDARADVFALGVMLYEILTGELPWPVQGGTTGSDPLRPSVRVTRTSQDAAGRQTAAAVRPRAAELRGDLDWITLHALARDPAERYATVDLLAADLERHRRGETVSVGPPSLAYRARKFVRRHRMVVITGTGALAVALAGLVFSFAAEARTAASFAQTAGLVERLLARANEPALRDAPRGDATRQVLLTEARAACEVFLQTRPSEPRLLAGRSRALLSLSQLHWLLGEAKASGETAAAAAADAERLRAGDGAKLEWSALLAAARQRQGHALRLERDDAGAHAHHAAAAALYAECAAADPTRHTLALAAARRDATMTRPGEDLVRRIEELRGLVAMLEQARAGQTDASAWAGEFLEAACSLARELRLQDLNAEAYEQLARAAAVLPLVTTMRLGRSELVQHRQAVVAWAMRDTPRRAEAALQHAQQAIETATAWAREQPQQRVPQVRLAEGLELLGHMQNYREDFVAASTNYRAAIACHEALMARFPEDATRREGLVRALADYALVLTDRFRQVDLDEASACAARAVANTVRVVRADSDPPKPRWELLALRAVIERARSGGEVDAACGELAGELAEDPAAPTVVRKDSLVGAWLSLVHWQLGAGAPATAATWLAKARAQVDASSPHLGKRAIEVGWLEARLAALRGDHAECAAAATRVAAARRSWLATKRTGDCLFLAWRCATAAAAPAAVGTDYRQQATALYARAILTLDIDVAQAPDDPWFVLPWGFMRLHAAELAVAEGDSAAAREHLAKSLPRLEAVRASCHADQWDEAAFRNGLALRDRLAAGR